ncbi:MutS protein 1 [Schizosaccharomyces japonicus yFS275]|uniref:MutS protein 1 n=1 Tax=Schizosaccharomyces japonicus (strain yFS275 / FY16936) TaxID=402676 RepID=B6JYY4_SCHJY|nr:MutS protein 1 [Schizosaccharomyces japonicus yFS275]EEB06752.1 MutS protein 1 [Schizosaccharomyces japonicus yFS275]
MSHAKSITAFVCRVGRLRTQHLRTWDCGQVRQKSTIINGLLKKNNSVPLKPIEPTKTLPPVLRGVRLQQERFPDCVLLTKVGGFYELYFQQAEEVAPLLNLRVSQRRTSLMPVSMAGFPAAKLDRYLKILVQDMNLCVALSEEIPKAPDDFSTSNLYNRVVTRVISPGTLIDESFISPGESNFILSIATDESLGDIQPETLVGLTWLDLSTGEFYVKDSSVQELAGDIERISPREVLLDTRFKDEKARDLLFSDVNTKGLYFSYTDPEVWEINQWRKFLDRPLSIDFLEDLKPVELQSGSHLLQYVSNRLMNSKTTIQHPIRYSPRENMVIGACALRSLEIRHSFQEGRIQGTLLHAINRTVTHSGARLLVQRLCSPSTNVRVINERLDLVEAFVQNPSARIQITELLKKTSDSERLLQRSVLGRGSAQDFLGLASTFHLTMEIKTLLRSMNTNPSLVRLTEALNTHEDLCQRISNTIDEEALYKRQEQDLEAKGEVVEDLELDSSIAAPVPKTKSRKSKSSLESVKNAFLNNLSDIWIVKPSTSPALLKEHEQLKTLYKAVEKLQSKITSTVGDNVTLRRSPSKMYFVYIKSQNKALKSKFVKTFQDATVFNTTLSTANYHLPSWSCLGLEIEATKTRISQLEAQTLMDLQTDVLKQMSSIRESAKLLNELDISTSLASLALEGKWVRPIVNNSCVHKVIQGRHPIVEKALQQKMVSFTANDCYVGKPSRIWLITGPNMAGKSTFLRQNALIAILAQMGSFVPASFAEIGVIDQIFSRVGSADNLSQHKSTFMEEMMESAFILKNATPRSFVIMDEVGRGTTTKEGIAIGYGCLEHLRTINKSRVLFATHSHELATLVKDEKEIECYCTDLIVNEDDTFVFDHRVRKGVNRNSHGLRVAALAGVPLEAIKTAKSILKREG